MKSRRLGIAVALAFAGAALLTSSLAGADVAIPYTRSTLPNGMVVIFHEDHSVQPR
jgi:hypothetical protein